MKGCKLWGGDQGEDDEHYDDGQRVGGRPRPISTTPNRTKVQLLPDRRLLRGQLFSSNLLHKKCAVWFQSLSNLINSHPILAHCKLKQNPRWMFAKLIVKNLACCAVSDQMGIRHDRLPDGSLQEGAVHQDQEDPSLGTTPPAPGVWGEEQTIQYNLGIQHIRVHFQFASPIFVIIRYLGLWQLGNRACLYPDMNNGQLSPKKLSRRLGPKNKQFYTQKCMILTLAMLLTLPTDITYTHTLCTHFLLPGLLYGSKVF